VKHRDSELNGVMDTLRHHTTRTINLSGPGVKAPRVMPALEVTLGKARTVIKVASSASSKPDGFSSTTPGNGNPGGGKGGRKLMRVPGEHQGDIDLVPTSSTEVDAIDRPTRPDTVTVIGAEVYKLLRQLAHLHEQLDGALVRFERLQSTAGVEDPPMCWLAQVRYKLPWDIQWEPFRTTDFAGVIAEPFDEQRKVSSFVYWFARNHKRLPERGEMLEYLERQTVKVHA
jgi:hypothetical protein